MIQWLKQWLSDWFHQRPHIDVVSSAIDGTPLVQLITPRGIGGRWNLQSTNEAIQGSIIKFGIQKDLGKHSSYAIDALEGRLNNLFTEPDLEAIAVIVGAALKAKIYTAFKHNGKPHMEFVTYTFDRKVYKQLEQAFKDYEFRKLSNKEKS